MKFFQTNRLFDRHGMALRGDISAQTRGFDVDDPESPGLHLGQVWSPGGIRSEDFSAQFSTPIYMVWMLKNWGNGDELKERLTKSLADPDKLSVFLREMVGLATSSGGRGFRKIYSISFKDWSSFVDMNVLSEHARSLTVDEKDELLKAIVDKLVMLTSPERVGDLPEKAYVISWDSDGRFVEDKHDAYF